MSITNNLPPTGSPGAQLIAQGGGASASSASNAVTDSDSSSPQSLYVASGSAQQSSIKDRAGTIGTALKSRGNVGNTVASDFGAWCQSRGVPKSAASFSTFSQQYSTNLQSAGLSKADADTAIGQGQAATFSGQQVRNFTLGQGQV